MKKKINVRRIVIIVAAVVLLIVLALLISEWIMAGRALKVQKEALELLKAGENAPETDRVIPGITDSDSDSKLPPAVLTHPWEGEDGRALVVQKDFLELYKANDHLVGWIKAGERVDYPVVQYDNSFYLNHDFYRKSDACGSIFLNSCNSLVPRDDVLLIHGHEMSSGLLFGSLHKFMDYDYLCRYPTVMFRTIYDAEDVYYTPIAVLNASMIKDHPDYFNLTRVSFEDDADADGEGRQSSAFEAYLDELAIRSLWQPKTDVTVEDKLIVLVTCSYFQDDGRLMLVCRQLRDGETPESITALYAE